MRRIDGLLRRLEPIWAKYPIRFAYLWGSRASRRRAGPRSDWDFAVSMSIAGNELDPLLDLGHALALELGTDDVDVTLLEDGDPLVRFLVQHRGRLVYERDPEARREFEHRARVVYWDEAIRLRRYDRAMAARLEKIRLGA